VSKGRAFYGPEGPYACFAGRDARVALAKGRLDAVDGGALTENEMQNLERWQEKLGAKYEIVGVLDTEE
jgi:membrane-associated progesterone receptor component